MEIRKTKKPGKYVVYIIALIVLVIALFISWPFSVPDQGQNSENTGAITTKEAADSPKAIINDPATIKAATEFARKATIGNMFEVESSRVALNETKNNKIKKFAEMMIDHHSQADQQLRASIDASSVEMENIPDQMDEEHTAKVEKLKTVSGTEFDNLYVAEQRKAHEEAVVLYRNYSNNGEDRALKSYATKTLLVIEEHQRQVKDLN